MSSWETDEDLKSEVEKTLSWRISPSQWVQLRDSVAWSHEPYDHDDVAEHVEKAEELFAREDEHETREAKPSPPSAHLRRSEEIAARFESRAVKLRIYLGLKQALKRADIRAYLKKFEPAKIEGIGKQAKAITLRYADGTELGGAVVVATTNAQTENKNTKLLVLKQEIEQIVRRTGWHEGQATNFVLTGEIPILPYLKVTQHYVYGDTLKLPSISITAHGLEISAKEVRDTYLKARNEMITEYEGKRTRSYRPQRPSRKTLDLIYFVDKHPDLSWEERRRLWARTSDYKHYTSADSMKVSYSRAKRRLGR